MAFAESTLPLWERRFNCDIPGHDIESMPKPNADACETACKNNGACAGYVFITGWNRCQLKKSAQRQFEIKMISGKITTDKNGRRVAKTLHDGYDHKGKDMESQPRKLKDREQCAAQCAKEPRCRGFVYINGYSACWLKHTDGDLQSKQFICGFPKLDKS